ncbi:MAG: DEAD/DEAH box helicase [Armatimonadetes bacterium]|nr:DEAD/DEAH box helicase [Armatimonadota bacterium]
MDARALLSALQHARHYEGQIAQVVEIPARPPRYADLREPLPLPLQAALADRGITRLYTHQVEAIEHLRAGRNVVVVTGTASGKTLCYNLPVLEELLRDPLATALFIYPTKALAQDQLRGLSRFGDARFGISFVAGTYDGDTPPGERRRLRDSGNIVLTNPDMLHQAILPHHSRWNRFFTHLKYVVIDEVHAYRGVFGSHLANVMRRLHRICQRYGATPLFLCSSATIHNPVDHAARITGRGMELVNDDGSPRGPKRFVLWNPPVASPPSPLSTEWRGDKRRNDTIAASASAPAAASTPPLHSMERGPEGEVPSAQAPSGERRSPLTEAMNLLCQLVREEVQTIAFVRTRLAAELISRGAKEYLGRLSPRLPDKIAAYRGGYLPEERREIERRLAEGEILGVVSTNALELGIDIGSLDASILVGYPGSIASLWQQAGRAGRGAEEALIFLVADNAPLDQYLIQHSEYLFEQSPENAVIDPDNPHVTIGHLKSAAYELPIADEEVGLFGEYAETMLEILEDQKLVKHLSGRWHWASTEYPAATVNLRNIGGPVYNIVDDSRGHQVIGTMDEISAWSQLHTHAIYLHDAESYLVLNLDIDNAIAHVEKRELDYYTQAVTSSRLQIEDTEEERQWRGCHLGFGEVTVTTTIPMFKKVKYHSRDSLGFEKLELPPQVLETMAFWLVPPDACREAVRQHGLVQAEGLIGVANCLVEVAPMFVMCDVQDIGVVVDASNLGADTLFLYDRTPGGMGYALRCMDAAEELLQAVHQVISTCPCADGCPSCVGAAVPAFAQTDLDSGTRGRIPDKEAALIITHHLLGLEPYVPKPRERRVQAAVPPSPEPEPPPDSGPPDPTTLRRKLSDLGRRKG